MSATGYWHNHDMDFFLEETTTDAQVKGRCSSFTFANGSPVYHDAILGNWVKDRSGNLTSAQSFLVSFDLPDEGKGADEFESRMLEALDKQRRVWMQEDKESGEVVLNMDPMTIYAYEIEFMRAIEGDIYLVFVVSFIMCGFVALTMAKFGKAGHSKLKSRAILGMFAVYTVGMSYLAGNGLMFICGIPFTTVTQILPFVVVGIGLDVSDRFPISQSCISCMQLTQTHYFWSFAGYLHYYRRIFPHGSPYRYSRTSSNDLSGSGPQYLLDDDHHGLGLLTGIDE
jgi:Niemann-Pick C1 protein